MVHVHNRTKYSVGVHTLYTSSPTRVTTWTPFTHLATDLFVPRQAEREVHVYMCTSRCFGGHNHFVAGIVDYRFAWMSKMYMCVPCSALSMCFISTLPARDNSAAGLSHVEALAQRRDPTNHCKARAVALLHSIRPKPQGQRVLTPFNAHLQQLVSSNSSCLFVFTCNTVIL